MIHQLTLNFTENQMNSLWHTRMTSFWPEQKERFEYVEARANNPANEFVNACWFKTDMIGHENLNMFWLDTNADVLLFCAMLSEINCHWIHFNDLADGSHCVISDYQPR